MILTTLHGFNLGCGERAMSVKPLMELRDGDKFRTQGEDGKFTEAAVVGTPPGYPHFAYMRFKR